APHGVPVRPTAVPAAVPAATPVDPGPQPRLGDPATDAAYRSQAVEVLLDSSLLDASSDASMDVSPGTIGGNDLGSNDGRGHSLNPATGTPSAPDVARAGDYYRAVVEFWADGPSSETPPGHWNVIANAVSDQIGSNLRVGGSGPLVDRLQWDVKLYLALNGSVHDAAIA